jgi:hypothetical protein
MTQYPSQSPFSFNSVPEGTNRTLLLIVSFIIPIVGIILGVMYMTKPDEASQKFGRHALIAAVSAFVVFTLCFICYFIFIFGFAFAPIFLMPSLEPSGGLLLLVS